MIQRDYIMRMIEQIGVLIGHIFDKNIAHENTEQELDAVTAQWIGLPSSILLSLPAAEVYRMFEESDRMVAGKSFLMAEVCRAKGLTAEPDEERREFLEKALFFYDRCSGTGWEAEVQSKVEERMEELTLELS